MGQVTSRISDELEGELDSWAARIGRKRSDLIRDILTSAAAGHQQQADAGQAEPPADDDAQPAAVELDLKGAVATIRWLEQTLVEFKQVAGDLQRQSSELQVLKRDDANAMHRARAEFLEGYPERIMKSQKPVHDRLAELSARMADLPGIAGIHAILTRIEAAVGEALATMVNTARADRAAAAAEARATRVLIEKAMAEPRTINTIDLRTWTLGQLGLVAGLFWLFSVGVLYGLIMILPSNWLAIRTANHLLGGGGQAVCQLVNYRQSTDTCRFDVDGRGSLVTIGGDKGKRR